MRLLLLSALFMVSFQNDGVLLSKWKSYPIPKETATLSKYEKSSVDYAVYLKYGDVYATKDLLGANMALPFLITSTPADSGKLKGNRSILQVDNGYLVAFYRAAGGGSLYWFATNGKTKYKIAESPILQLLESEGRYYGVAADTLNSIVKIAKKGSSWTVQPYKKFSSTPRAAGMDEQGNMVMITDKSLLSVDKKGGVHSLIDKGFWDGYLFPRTLVVHNGVAYTGMRKGVLKYELGAKKASWLMENN